MLKSLLSALLALLPVCCTLAQNCSINAGLNATICLSDSMKLYGTRSGLFSPNATCRWTQISGSNTTILQPDSLVTRVVGYTEGSYLFKLTNRCQDGIISEDTISVIVRGITIAEAGNDTVLCPDDEYQLQGNALADDETGSWIVLSGTSSIIIQNPQNPKSEITLLAGSPGIIKLRWIIKNSLGCVSFDDVSIVNRGGIMPVNAGADQTLDRCYAGTACTKLVASNGGTGFGGQTGVWTFISGPSMPLIPTVNNPSITVCNLVSGVYVFRYTVYGPCANGFDEVTVTVPPPSENLSANNPGQSFTLCDGASTATLYGSVPAYAGETVQWTQLSGPVQVRIHTPGNPSSLVSGLTLPGHYVFNYNITNSLSGCVANAAMRIVVFESGTVDGGPDQILPCNVTETTIQPDTTGYGHLNYRIVSGPTGAFTYPTAFSDRNTIKDLMYPGTYRIQILYQFGADCPSVNDYVDITVSRTPTGSNAGTSQNFPCAAANTQLAGNNPILTGFGNGQWSQLSGPNQASLLHPGNYICTIANTLPGAYYFRWTVSGGNTCPDSHDDIRVIISGNSVTRSDAGNDKTICFNAPLTLDGNAFRADETGTWTASPSNVTFTPNNKVASPTVTGLQPDMRYTFTYTIANACGNSSVDTAYIRTSSINGPTIAKAGTDQCLPAGTTSIQLNGNAPTSGTGKWIQVTGTPVVIAQPSSPATNVIGLGNGSYSFVWTITVSGCENTSSDTVMVTIGNNTTPANAGNDITLCGKHIELNGNTPVYGTGSWSLISGDGNVSILSPSSPLTAVENIITGLYTFRWTISNGACTSSTDDVQVNVSIPPSAANAGNDLQICQQTNNGMIQLNASTPTNGTGEWLWVSGNTPNVIITDSRNPKTTVSGLGYGKHIFSWVVKGGATCPVSADEMSITISLPANAGQDKNLCNLTATTLRGNTGSMGRWTQVSGPTATIVQIPAGNPNANISSLQANATYIFRYTIDAIGDCPATSDEVLVKNGSPSVAPNAGRDDIYCDNSAFPLQGSLPSTGETGTWSIISGPSGALFTPNASAPDAILTGVQNGIYILKWTISNNACNVSDIKKIENNAAPGAAHAGPDDTLCGADFVFMHGNMPQNGIGVWTQIKGPSNAIIDAPNQPETKIYRLVPGTYTFRWTISNPSCPVSFDDVNITALEKVPVPVCEDDFIICGDSMTLIAQGFSEKVMCSWKQIAGPGNASLATPNRNTCSVTGLHPGKYTFVFCITNSKCERFDTMNVTIQSNIMVNAGSDMRLCNQAGGIQLSGAEIVGNTADGIWSILSGRGTLSYDGWTSHPELVLFTPEPGYAGPVELQLRADGNCGTVKDMKTIWVENEKIQMQANNDTAFTPPGKAVNINVLHNDWAYVSDALKLCNNKSITVTPSHGSVDVQLDGSVIYRPVAGFSGIDSFSYKVCNEMIADSSRSICMVESNDNAWVYVIVEGCIIPNSFSPDGDGVNDYFEIPCARGYAQIDIFNRWGIEVYKNDAYQNDWNGTYNGESLPDGTYFYMLSYNNENSNRINKNGFITIRR